MHYSTIVLCAGKGSRTGLAYNKMLYSLKGETVYEKTMKVFLADERCHQIVVVCKPQEQKEFEKFFNDQRIEFVEGGKERQDSVYCGLQKVTNAYVMIHDGARPYVKKKLLDDIMLCLQKHDACLVMVPCKDTIKEVHNGKVVKTLKRSSLMQAQTPQAFKTSLIVEAYKQAHLQGLEVTDDASVVEMTTNESVEVVVGDYDNIKITTQEDLV